MPTNRELSLARASSRPPVGILILRRTVHTLRLVSLSVVVFRRALWLAFFVRKLKRKNRNRNRFCSLQYLKLSQIKIDFRCLKPIHCLNIILPKTSRKHMVVLSRIGECVCPKLVLVIRSRFFTV